PARWALAPPKEPAMGAEGDALFDVVVVGAGPAGMSAALEAHAHGASVLLLDEQPAAGGQIYRGVGSASQRRLQLLGPDYAAGRELTDALRAGVEAGVAARAQPTKTRSGHPVHEATPATILRGSVGWDREATPATIR